MHLHKGQIPLGRDPQAAVVPFEGEREPRVIVPPIGYLNRRLTSRMLRGSYGIVTGGQQIACGVDLKGRVKYLILRRCDTHNSQQTVRGFCVGSPSCRGTPTEGSLGVWSPDQMLCPSFGEQTTTVRPITLLVTRQSAEETHPSQFHPSLIFWGPGAFLRGRGSKGETVPRC